MYRLLLLSISIVLTCQQVYSQNKDSIVQDIQKTCAEIRDELEHFDSVTVELREDPTAGRATAWFYKGQFRLIEVVWTGIYSKRKMAYYFFEDELVFASDHFTEYNEPITQKDETTVENPAGEEADLEISAEQTNSYFFIDQKLILWMDKDGNQPDLTLGTNTLVGQGLLAHCYKIMDEFKKR